MNDRYFGEFALALGLIFLCVGFYRLSRNRQGQRDRTKRAGTEPRQPAWGFLALGMLLFSMGAFLVSIL